MDSKNIPKKKSTEKIDLSNKVKKTLATQTALNTILIVMIVGLLVFGGLIVYLNTTEITNQSPLILQKLSQINSQIFKGTPKVVAVVNNEAITLDELNSRYDLLPEEYKQLISIDDVLDQIVEEKILLQEAEKADIEVSDMEVDQLIDNLLQQNQMTMEEFLETIKERGMTLEQVKEFYKRDIAITKLINKTITPKISISDTDIKDYYFTNQEQFIVPESRNVSHILICHNESLQCTTNRSKEEAFDIALELLETATRSNFDDLAANNSEDFGSRQRGGNLGWITQEDPFIEAFVNATFTTDANETSGPVETVFGYHLIFVHEIAPNQTIELETVYDRINQSLRAELLQEQYDLYLDGLRNNSQVLYIEKN